MALKLAVIGGDGIGPEVTEQALRVLEGAAEQTGLDYTTERFPFGAEHYLRTGHILDDADVEALRGYDAIVLGAVGGKPNDPQLAGGVIEKGILLKLRFALDLYINLRPVRLYEGVDTPLAGKGPEAIDFVVVRENTEDLYSGLGEVMRAGTPQEIATQTMTATWFGVERCVRYAFDLAMSRGKRLTLVHKTNVLTYAGATWWRAFEAVAGEYPEVETNYHHVDACCMYMVQSPEVYDTIVTPNMFGDIITDLGAAIAGGMGIAASGNLNPTGAAPSMFEPVHGSAPDIAGEGRANPIAAIDSMGLLLRETGRIKGDAKSVQAGERVGEAVQRVTPRFAGKRLDRSGYSTEEVGRMVIESLG